MLIVVDTFQMVRGNNGEPTYGSDYQEMQKLKRIADSQRISILLVHHLRKQGDRDPINKRPEPSVSVVLPMPSSFWKRTNAVPMLPS